MQLFGVMAKYVLVVVVVRKALKSDARPDLVFGNGGLTIF